MDIVQIVCYQNKIINKKDFEDTSVMNCADKKNKFTPGTSIKITDEKAIKKFNPDYMLVLPWYFKNEIIIISLVYWF